ncbi:MAG: DUF4019 domain-containing protein [Pyrinomonadaceae bacterium]
MKIQRVSHLLTILFLLSSFGIAQTKIIDRVDITTVGAPWMISILGKDLDINDVQAKPDRKSGYFLMKSESSGLNVSIFIEPVDKCYTGGECRDFVLNLGNPAWGKFQDLKKSKIKDFSYFEFFRPEVQGKPLKMLDMYAEYVGQGYWIDLHISKVQYKKEDHLLFEDIVKSINFVPKNGSAGSGLEGTVEQGKQTVAAWLKLWDAAKCRESYAALSSLSQSGVEEKLWIDYCDAANKALGKPKSRKLIASSLIKLLPGKTNAPVAILGYQSDFENRESVVELVSSMLEKDGGWSVTNYLTR